MTKREFYKFLKEKKLFDIFRIVCFSSYMSHNKPSYELECYIQTAIRSAELDPNGFIRVFESVRHYYETQSGTLKVKIV